ncbi:3691_t:CDS:2 [Ambispora leptoticha]|uniref:Thioredoxin n=1 Tax=Ambispora leptoticha TaxID=144679 RepID=A0A9N8V7E0_9GLOM|nr:3691_t:CDS:2 [Ambispora leptoticha]
MALVYVDKHEEFYQQLQANTRVIVDFYAEWCGPCKVIAPFYEELANSNPDLTFLKVDNVCKNEGISAMPTFKTYIDGKVSKEFVGINRDEIEKLVNELKPASAQ